LVQAWEKIVGEEGGRVRQNLDWEVQANCPPRFSTDITQNSQLYL